MATVYRLLAYFIGLVLIVAFAVANRHPTVIEFFPLPIEPIEMPVYGVLIAGLMIGAVLGGGSAWLSNWAMRSEWRRLKQHVRRIEEEERQQRLREEEAAANRTQRRKEKAPLTAESRQRVPSLS